MIYDGLSFQFYQLYFLSRQMRIIVTVLQIAKKSDPPSVEYIAMSFEEFAKENVKSAVRVIDPMRLTL